MSLKGYFCELIVACVTLFFFSSVQAVEFSVVSTQMNKVENIYHLSVELGYELSAEVNEALENGIPVTLRLDIEILHQREFLWAQEIMAVSRRFRIRYHALSGQYLVKDLSTDEQTFYKVLDDALYNLEHIVGLPILDAQLLDPGKKYLARVRTRVDIKELPVPLRYFAYFSSGWNLTSDWFTWDLSV